MGPVCCTAAIRSKTVRGVVFTKSEASAIVEKRCHVGKLFFSGAITPACTTRTHTHAWLRSCEMKVELLRRQRMSPGSEHLRLPPFTQAASLKGQTSNARRAFAVLRAGECPTTNRITNGSQTLEGNSSSRFFPRDEPLPTRDIRLLSNALYLGRCVLRGRQAPARTNETGKTKKKRAVYVYTRTQRIPTRRVLRAVRTASSGGGTRRCLSTLGQLQLSLGKTAPPREAIASLNSVCRPGKSGCCSSHGAGQRGRNWSVGGHHHQDCFALSDAWGAVGVPFSLLCAWLVGSASLGCARRSISQTNS